jgi:pseudaminic acid synthase
MNKEIVFGNHTIGGSSPAFCIAELSCNHLQNYDLAIRTIDAMIDAGADCVKMQIFDIDKMTLDCQKPDFLISGGTLWDNRTFYSLYKETFTPWEWFEPIMQYVQSRGVEFLASVFDRPSVDFMEKMGAKAYKIASFEITDIPLVRYVASKGRPVIISTGIAFEEDINLAVETCRSVGNDNVILLKCTSEYPAPLEDVNLRQMTKISHDYDCIVGISDHTLGDVVAIAAVALGGKLVEKHFILDRNLGGPDAPFSMEPEEFAAMVRHIHDTEMILGSEKPEMSEKNKNSRRFSRSLYVAKDMKKGDVIDSSNVMSVRPGYGLHPKYLDQLIGKKVNQDIEKGTRFSMKFVD